MSTPEGEVRAYLKQRVEALGGEVRAMKWIGRRHAPDVYVMIPPGTEICDPGQPHCPKWVHYDGSLLAECKAPGKRPRPGQVREHERLRKYGITVLVLPTKEDIDKAFPL